MAGVRGFLKACAAKANKYGFHLTNASIIEEIASVHVAVHNYEKVTASYELWVPMNFVL